MWEDILLSTSYTLTRDEKKSICNTLFNLKVLKGYSSNFKHLMSRQDLKVSNLKSHDCHTLMQQLLSIAISGVLPKHVRNAITQFCFFFNAICSKVVDMLKLEEIQTNIVTTLCLLEKYFSYHFLTLWFIWQCILFERSNFLD